MNSENNKKISCIIPAYNEGPRIKNVLEIITSHPLVNEVIVVDDGSIDGTKDVVSGFPKVKLIVHLKNLGKSYALYNGIKGSSNESILLIDADLLGLTAQNITDLISPILNKTADVTISLRRNSPKTWHRIGIDYISGERVMPRSIIASHLEEILKLKPFGIDVFFNRLIVRNSCKIKIVKWPNVDSPYKISKAGLWKGIKGDIFMILDIFRTISIFGIIYQITKMRKLMVK